MWLHPSLCATCISAHDLLFCEGVEFLGVSYCLTALSSCIKSLHMTWPLLCMTGKLNSSQQVRRLSSGGDQTLLWRRSSHVLLSSSARIFLCWCCHPWLATPSFSSSIVLPCNWRCLSICCQLYCYWCCHHLQAPSPRLTTTCPGGLTANRNPYSGVNSAAIIIPVSAKENFLMST